MYRGDLSRKTNLVNYGFRMRSAYDNRPLTFEEFDARVPQMICVSATPAEYELGEAGQVVEQIIRPTGLLDPEIEVRPVKGQIDDLLGCLLYTSRRFLAGRFTKRREDGLRVRILSLIHISIWIGCTQILRQSEGQRNRLTVCLRTVRMIR